MGAQYTQPTARAACNTREPLQVRSSVLYSGVTGQPFLCGMRCTTVTSPGQGLPACLPACPLHSIMQQTWLLGYISIRIRPKRQHFPPKKLAFLVQIGKQGIQEIFPLLIPIVLGRYRLQQEIRNCNELSVLLAMKTPNLFRSLTFCRQSSTHSQANV